MLSFSDKLKKMWNDDRYLIPRKIRDLKDNRVGLYTLFYNAQNETYAQFYEHVPKKDLPAEAVHISGKQGKEYIIDYVDAGKYPKPGYTNATDLYLYMMNNDIDDALTNVRKPLPIDTKYLAYIGIAVLAVVFIYASGLVSL